ncbi:MAG: hypothetical protein OXU45_09050, partial [Candidatus Melainabacteria bacterium]|nr:hypothetical protein [Candidatus Melainabacteria bacterium]
MPNNITQQAIDASSDSHKLTERATMQEYEQLKEGHAFLGQVAKEGQERSKAIAEYFASGAEQNKAQGENLMQSGTVKKTLGFGFVALGASFKAMAAIPFIGPIKASAGIEMMAKGAAQIAQGIVDHSQGKKLIAAANEALEKALSHNIISKDNAKVARKEINRSKIFERKIEILKQMLEEVGIDHEDLTEEQIEKLKEQIAEGFDQNFEDAAQTLLNNGVMALDGLTDDQGNELGTQFFIKEGDEFVRLDVPEDEDGNPLRGANGEPLVRFQEDGSGFGDVVEDGEVKDLLAMKFRFVDAIKSMAVGLTTSDFDADGNEVPVEYDLNNRAHLEEFVDLIFKSSITGVRNGLAPAPLAFTEQGGNPGLQRVEYDLDPLSENFGRQTPVGIFVTLDEIAGGPDPRGDGIESFTYAIERSQRSLAEVGLNQGGQIYGFVGPTTGRQADYT